MDLEKSLVNYTYYGKTTFIQTFVIGFVLFLNSLSLCELGIELERKHHC